jgi:hypothetical protein
VTTANARAGPRGSCSRFRLRPEGGDENQRVAVLLQARDLPHHRRDEDGIGNELGLDILEHLGGRHAGRCSTVYHRRTGVVIVRLMSRQEEHAPFL